MTRMASELRNHSWFAYLTVEGVDQLHEDLVARGATIIAPLVNEPWGMRELGIRTPDGHRLRFGELRSDIRSPGQEPWP